MFGKVKGEKKVPSLTIKNPASKLISSIRKIKKKGKFDSESSYNSDSTQKEVKKEAGSKENKVQNLIANKFKNIMSTKRTESTEDGNKTKISFGKVANKVRVGTKANKVFMSLLKDFKGKQIDEAIDEEK